MNRNDIIEAEFRTVGRDLEPAGQKMLPPPDTEPSVTVQGVRTNRPTAPPRIEGPKPRESFDFGPDNFKPKAAEAFPFEAPPSVAKTAAGVGLGILGAQAAAKGIEMLGEGVRAPEGSISAFQPGGGAGGGNDYAGAALSRAVLAALNSAGKIPTRY